jgi:hypothetical protein
LPNVFSFPLRWRNAGKFCRSFSGEVTRFLIGGALDVYKKEIPEKMEPLLAAANYQGPIGLDAFVYRAPDGTLRLRPAVEMNPRFTMRRLTWELMRRVTHGRTARFELIRSKNPADRARELETANPPVLGRDGKMASGCVVLNEPESVLAVLTVG